MFKYKTGFFALFETYASYCGTTGTIIWHTHTQTVLSSNKCALIELE